MELYGERGFDQTTVTQIAERAGLTERTFFRHFADKREVLFAGSGQLQDLLVQTVADFPARASPIEAVAAGIEAIGTVLQETRGRAFARQRQSIVAASAEFGSMRWATPATRGSTRVPLSSTTPSPRTVKCSQTRAFSPSSTR